jgi:FkbM family methyltransferase
MPRYAPVEALDWDSDQWTGDKAFPLRVAEWWTKYGPRGKGWVSRQVGRYFGGGIKCWILTKHGARLAVPVSSLDTITLIMNQGNTWNEHVLNTCARLLRNGDVFYDIGGNVGFMSIEMAQLFSDQISVIAIEPIPALSHSIAFSARLNKFNRVTVFGVMLGETEGPGELFIGSHEVHASAIPFEKPSRVVPCPLTTIDSMVGRGEIPPPNVIKMDIEGGELAALRGSEKTLRSHRPSIVFEYNVSADRFGYTKGDILDYLKSIGGYEFFSITTDAQLIPMGDDPPRGVRISEDVLARPNDR